MGDRRYRYFCIFSLPWHHVQPSNVTRSVNFNIDVVNGIIFVSGIAKTQEEMDLVLSHAKETKYTKQLVNYIKLVENLSQ